MNYLNGTPSPQSHSAFLLDSGCNAHFFIVNAHCKNNKKTTQTPLEFHLPNGSTIASTHAANLDLPSFPNAASQAHILPGLAQHSLLYVGEMCDSGCAVTFISNKFAVTHGATKILTGQRDKDSGLWRVPLGNTNSAQATPKHSVHSVYEQKSIHDNITHLHACCFGPVQDTWLKSIQNGHFTTRPSLTVENVRKYLPKSDTMVKGNMTQIHQHSRSNQPVVADPTPESELVQEDKCNFMYVAIMETNQIYISHR
jgi:hypothetical protein